MIPKECKRLAEVDFPIAVVSKHSAREKSIRHGHPSTLHLWWARRPLAACRAILLGLLLPDPVDPHCPEDFKTKARELLSQIGGTGTTDYDLQRALLKFIGDFANWDNSSHATYLKVSRGLVKAAHGEEPPLVVDPFAGGGSVPLEALRLGCEAFASDINPVACLILKVMLEDIPRHGPKLAEELRRVGAEIKREAEKELAEFYPRDPDGSTPIAYLWARTVRCESPNCGAEIPLVRSFWLCKKANRKRALRPVVSPLTPNPLPAGEGRVMEIPSVDFEIFEPESDKDVPNGTVNRAKATCLCCSTVLPPDRVRAQLREQRGGADVVFEPSPSGGGKGEGEPPLPKRISGARLLAVVTLRPGEQGRHYRLPTEQDYLAVWKAQRKLREILDEWEREGRKGLCPVPDESSPEGGGSGAGRAFSVRKYGMNTFGDLFMARQKVGMVILIKYTKKQINSEVTPILGLLLGKSADGNNSLSRWMAGYENPVNLFSRQAMPIVWDFCESTPTSEARGVFLAGIYSAQEVIDTNHFIDSGQVQKVNASQILLPNDACNVWFTDPPYYDAIPYSDLSDFFFVWLKRALPGHPLLCDPFDLTNPLTPKVQEIVQDETNSLMGGQKTDSSLKTGWPVPLLKDGGYYEMMG